jgi:cystathionine beta-lyase/cystathionine gamma-synthase
MGGVISGSRQLIGSIRSTITSMGGILRPFDAVLLLRGLRTLGIRMERCTATALQVARYLEGHPKVARVRYGGLASWDGYHVGATYLRGFGGMMGIEWKDSRTEAVFRQRVKICRDEGSFGRTATPVRRRGERYTRIAIGLEEPADLIADFEQALA